MWHKVKPSIDGFYWYRGDYIGAMDNKPVVIWIENGKAWQPRMDFQDDLDQFHGEWDGPIEP